MSLLGKRVFITANDGTELGFGLCVEEEFVGYVPVDERYLFLLDSKLSIMHAQCTWRVVDEADAPALHIPITLPHRTMLYRQYGEHQNWIESYGETLPTRRKTIIEKYSIKEVVVPGFPERDSHVAVPIMHGNELRYFLADDLSFPLYGVD